MVDHSCIVSASAEVTYLREILVDNGESHFVDVRIVMLLECLYLVQTIALLDQGAHLLQVLQLVCCLQKQTYT